MWTLLEIYEVQFIVQLRSRLWSRNISGPIISSVELLAESDTYLMPLDVILHMTVEVFFSASLIFLSAEVPDKAHICIHFSALQGHGPASRIPIAPTGTYAGLQSLFYMAVSGPIPVQQ